MKLSYLYPGKPLLFPSKKPVIGSSVLVTAIVIINKLLAFLRSNSS